MSFEYIPYSRAALKQDVQTAMLDEWRVDYLAFSAPENAHKPPLVVVGGAFQNFTSYKYSVERIYEDFPVVLVDLPSLGNNPQVAPGLGMEDLADLLYAFVQLAGWPRIHAMGLSLGSAIASTYAYKYPHATGKLLVTGIVTRPRKSWRMLVEESVRVLDQGRMDAFSQAVVLYLVNYARLEETGIRSTTRKMFQRQMKRLTDNERERYKINGTRLTTVEELLGYPKCDTLVATGEHDSFTLPWENAQFAYGCPNATFCLIENADHLAQLEQREASLEMFSAFLNERPMDTIKGIRCIPRAHIPNMERRRNPRLVPVDPSARLIAESPVDSRYRLDIPVDVIDISFFGCRLHAKAANFPVASHARDCTLLLRLPKLNLQLLIFDYDDQGYLRCLFKHGDIKLANNFVAQLADPAYFQPQNQTSVLRRLSTI